MKPATVLIVLALAAASVSCAGQPAEQAPAQESLVPGNIGIAVERKADTLVVVAVRRGSAAASVRLGDVVRSYNGIPVANEREFNRLVLGSEPGRTAHLEIARDGAPRSIELPVSEIDPAPLL
ncbi:MAG: PDZ domain-containing protein [Betaproteobacteria bacterium]|nr:MAG: PDZ domain-containing protein [Betaproteobacteria bacterium]